VRVFLIRPGELGPAEIAAWQSMQRATPSLANPFLSAEFAVAVGRFRANVYVAVLTEGQSITGFFPFERRRLSVGVPINGWLTPCQGLIHAPGVDWDPRELLRGCRLSAWRFDSLIVGQRPFEPYHAATAASAMIDLADGFDAYYAKLRVKSPRFCRELARRTRKLAREAGELRIVADSRDISVLRTLMAWKSDQYRRTSHVDRFEWPWLAGLLDALLATRGDHVSGLLSVLYAGDQPVAAQFGLRAGNLLVGWFTGYDTRFRRYSPGLIQLRQMAEELAATGIHAIDMGGGARNYYKETLKSHDILVAEGIVTGRSMLAAAHRVRTASTRWARRTLRQHPSLHHAADRILRRSGVARRTYGRVLWHRGRGRLQRSGPDDSKHGPVALRDHTVGELRDERRALGGEESASAVGAEGRDVRLGVEICQVNVERYPSRPAELGGPRREAQRQDQRVGFPVGTWIVVPGRVVGRARGDKPVLLCHLPRFLPRGHIPPCREGSAGPEYPAVLGHRTLRIGPVPRLRIGDEVRAAIPQRKRVSVALYPAHTGRGPGQFGEHARGGLDRDYLRATLTHLPCRDPCASSHVYDQRTTQAASGQVRQHRIEFRRVVRPSRRVAPGHRAEYSRHRHSRCPSCDLSRPYPESYPIAFRHRRRADPGDDPRNPLPSR